MSEQQIDLKESIMRCCFGTRDEVRADLLKNQLFDCKAVEEATSKELTLENPDLKYLQALANALIAFLPTSHAVVQRLLLMSKPRSVFELHFSMFVALSRSDFNGLEQDGVEYMLSEYLREVKSTASYAAWKAGLVLGEDWLSPRTEALLKRLMRTARNPAGRLGAINGYRFIVQRRKTFTPEEFAVLEAVAERDKNLKVREQAEFDLNRLRTMQSENTTS
jgi:hypothetical protein